MKEIKRVPVFLKHSVVVLVVVVDHPMLAYPYCNAIMIKTDLVSALLTLRNHTCKCRTVSRKGGDIALYGKPISELWSVTCLMGLHSVT